MNDQIQPQREQPKERTNGRPRAASTTFNAPSNDASPVTINDHPSPPRRVQAAALHNGNDTVTALSAHAVDNPSQVAGDASSAALMTPTDTPSACSSACWMILGPVVAGVVVAAMIFGLVMVKRRRRLRANSEPRTKEKDKSNVLDDDDLMVEMFEPPELLSSGNISGAFFNWRNASQAPPPPPDKEGRRGSAQFSGRSTMLGLTTILEEGSNHDPSRIKKYHGNIRRPSNKGNGNLSPLRIASPNPVLRGPFPLNGLKNLSMGDTPPLSPLISPSASPAPSDPVMHPTQPGPIYLSAPVGRQKRKLTIPYTPQDVTRRRSLEGAW